MIADAATSGYVVPYGGTTYQSGQIIKRGYVQTNAHTALNTAIAIADTAPATNTGDEILSLSFTPILSTSKIHIEWSATGTENSNVGDSFTAFMFLVGDTNARATATSQNAHTAVNSGNLIGLYEFTPGSAATFTVKVNAGANGGQATLNKAYNAGGGALFHYGDTIYSWLKIEEIAP